MDDCTLWRAIKENIANNEFHIIYLKPQIFFWTFFAAALVASQVQGSLSVVKSVLLGGLRGNLQ